VTAFRELWDEIAPIGRDASSGGYVRYAWSPPELALREWFHAQAALRQMPVEEDGNGNLFAWYGSRDAGGAVLTGSHFDSVPHGGGYDGPLGIISALLALDAMRETGFALRRPVAVAVFAEEEGSRFGLACLGSRLLTGAVTPSAAADLRDRDGATLADVLGGPPAGARPDLLGRFGAFVELHVEQGRALTRPVGVATAIWPHGRWRVDIEGEGNHAGTTPLSERHDPMLTYAFAVLTVNEEARLRGAHATVGRVAVAPNATNAVPARVSGWLDARAADAPTLAGLLDAFGTKVLERAGRDGTTVRITEESSTGEVRFDPGLASRLAAILGDAPLLPTGAGHDAGVLCAHLPTAMLFVRNPTGVSHAPGEHATDADCAAGVDALASVLTELAR
jgi:N-carbamoyl-L-amino-acid hydrolase